MAKCKIKLISVPSISRYMNALPCSFTKRDNFSDFLLTFLGDKSFKNGSNLKGKNLLLEEIPFYKVGPHLIRVVKMRMTELLPLKLYSFILGLPGAPQYVDFE